MQRALFSFTMKYTYSYILLICVDKYKTNVCKCNYISIKIYM